MINRTVTFAKHHTPNSVRVVVRRAMLETHNARMRLTSPVTVRSEYGNIYHCTVRKAASQWIKALFSDPIIYRYSGLLPFERRLYRRRFPHGIPEGRAVLSLFMSYKRFDKLPKPERYRAFFVFRDPRDIVVSDYYSLKTTHAPMGSIPRIRKVLQERPMKDGLLYVIQHLSDEGLFNSLRSWAVAPKSETLRLFHYEDLTGERQREEVDQMLRHCGIVLPPAELTTLLSRYSFSRMRKDPTGTPEMSHYRKGTPGDWRNHFDDDIYEAFEAATGNLVELLGYPARDQSVRARDE